MEDSTLVRPDFSEALDLTPWKPGWHHVRVEEATAFKGKEKGTPMLKWKFLAIKGAEVGKATVRNTPLAGEGAGFTQRVLEAINIDPKKAASQGLNLRTCAGKELLIRTEIELYEGEPRTKITAFAKIGTPVGEAQTITKSDVGKLPATA